MTSDERDPTDPTDPRWLDPEERNAFLAVMSIAVRLEPALDRQLRRDAGVTHFEYSVLVALSEASGRRLRMSDLARLADGSLSRLSQVVSRLERRGWVRRAVDDDDGRYTVAGLTEDGWAKVAATAPGHVREVRRLVVDVLTRAQIRQVTDIGRRIADAVDPGDRWPDRRTAGSTPPPVTGGQTVHDTTRRAGDRTGGNT